MPIKKIYTGYNLKIWEYEKPLEQIVRSIKKKDKCFTYAIYEYYTYEDAIIKKGRKIKISRWSCECLGWIFSKGQKDCKHIKLVKRLEEVEES